MTNYRRNWLALVAAIVAGIPAVAAIAIPIIDDWGDPFAPEALGRLTLGLALSSPAVIASYVWLRPGSRAEGPLLLAAALLSMALTLVAIFSVGFLFVPSVLLLGAAAARGYMLPTGTAGLPFLTVGAIVAASMVGVSLLALNMSQDDARCWVLTTDEGGQYYWEEREPNIQRSGSTFRSSQSLGANDIRGTCTSNAMTPTEGALGLALVGGGLLLLGALSLPRALQVVPE